MLRARPTAAEAASSFAAMHDLLQPVIGGLARLPVPQRRALAAALALEDSPGPVDPRLIALACRSLLAGWRVRSCSRSMTGSGSTPRRWRS